MIKKLVRRVKLGWYYIFNRREYYQLKYNPLPVWRYFDESN